MRPIAEIRERLGVTQQELGTALGCRDSNISHYERGQSIPEDRARKLIQYAKGRGLILTFDHVYGARPLATAEVMK